MTSSICPKGKLKDKEEESDEENGSAIEDNFRKISVPSDASCLFWAVTMAYLLPVKNHESLFSERFRKLFGKKGKSDLTRVRNLILNRPLNLVYEDLALIELVTKVFRNRVEDELLLQEEEWSRSVMINDYLRTKNEGCFITDGTFAEKFRSTFSSKIHLVDISKLKPSQLDESSINLLTGELDKVLDNDEIEKFKFQSYIKSMRSCESWAGPIEIEAIRKLLRCQIILINSKENARDITQINRNGINICLFNRNRFYYEFGLIKAKFVIEILKRERYQLGADYIDLGIDKIDYQDRIGNSLLHFAALSNNRHDIINRLIWQGADLNITNDTNQTPLQVANDFKLENSIAIFDEYYPKQIDANITLGLAFIEKHKTSPIEATNKVVNIFETQNIVPRKNSCTEAHLADDAGLLPSSLEPRTPSISLAGPADDNMRLRALHFAIVNNHLNVVQNLIENCEDIVAKRSAKNNSEFLNGSPLHCAVEKGQFDIVKVLIKKGKAEVDINDDNGGTPLQKAVKLGHLKLVKYLLEKDADINSVDKTFVCVLSNAAISGHVHIVQYLIENGVQLNLMDLDGMTPLHHAVEGNRWRVVQCLVEHKADLNIADKNNKTVLEKVISLGEWNVVKYLLEKGASSINLNEGIRNDIFKRFINNESSVQNQFYETIKLGDVEILEILLNKYSDTSEEMLAKAYEELRFSQVQLNQNICIFIESKLLDFRFFSHNQITSKKSAKEIPNLDAIKIRLNLVIGCINRMNDIETNDDVTDSFLYMGKFMAQNLQILKRQLPSTYEKLPWEEVQFCLLTFISGYTDQLERDIVNEVILSKRRLIFHLRLFRKSLADCEVNITSEDVKDKKIIREKAVENILKLNPEFEKLYKDFEILKDVYSLKRIKKHIQIACSVDLKEKPMIGQLVIERALQVIGECLKNTSDSPNLSDIAQNMLLSSAPLNVKQIITSLRDSLSHTNNALSVTAEIESNGDFQFFTKMQDDLRKLETDLLFILVDKNTQAIITFLERVLQCENVTDTRSLVSGVHINGKVSVEVGPKMYNNFFQIRNNFTDLSDLIKIKTEFEIERFRNIFETLDNYKNRIQRVQSEQADALRSLKALISLIKNNDNLGSIRNESQRLLISFSVTLECYAESASVYEKVSNFTFRLLDSVPTTPHLDYRIYNIFYQLFSTLKLEVRRIKNLETFKFSFENDNYSKRNNDETVLDKIERKMALFIDEISDPKTLTLFKEEYVKKKEVYNNKLRLLNEKNEPKLLNRKIDSYEILVAKLKKEPTNVFMKNAFADFIRSFNAHKKLSKNFINNHENIFFDSEIYFEKMRTLENIFGKAKRDCDVENLLRDNVDIRVAVEMLMLTLLEILETLSLLETNRLFLDAPSPILIGKNLRNYLAHGDLLIEILSIDHVKAITSHYRILKRFSDENKSTVYSKNTLIGKLTAEDIPELKKSYEHKLEIVNKRNELFGATLSSDETAINNYLITNKSVEINISRSDGSTFLHLAALTDNVKLFKFFLNHNVNLYKKEIFGNSVIYYLIKFGSKNILKFLFNRFSIDLDAKLGSNATLMHLATKFNKSKVVKFLIANGADVEITNRDGHTPLHFATKNGYLDIIVALRQAGANLEVRNKNGLTLLHLASSSKFSRVVEYLIDNDLNIHAVDEDNRTPLHYACMFGHANIADILLKHSADVDAETTKTGESPLHFASCRGDDRLIQTLLNNSADPRKVARNGDTALHNAALNSNENAVLILLKNGANIEAENEEKVTPLLCACFNGHFEMIETLLELGANVNARAKEQTGLHVATVRNHVKSVKVLLSHRKTDVNIKDRNGRTALHLAAQRGNVEIIELLLASKSNVNERDDTGKTPLHLAVINNRNKAVESLINGNSEIDPGDQDGVTPLLSACNEGNLQIFDTLREKNANVLVKTHNKLTPFSVALAHGHVKILEKILPFDSGKDYENDSGQTPLHVAAFAGHDSVVKLLIKRGADVNERSFSDRSTALHLAARNGHDTTVTQLLNLGADVNATFQPFSRTALHEAADKGHAYVADILLQSGARVDALTVNHETPLHAAASSGHSRVIPVLVKHKANVMAKDVKTWSPIHTAAFFGFHGFIKESLSYGASVEELAGGGLSVMHIACHHGHLNVVKFLLTLEKSSIIMINQETVKGESPLYLAVRLGRFQVAECLIRHGADVFAKNAHDSVLHQAVKHNKILKLVLEEIRDKCEGDAERLRSAMNAPDGEGDTPLMWAAEVGNLGSVILLLKNKEVDIDRQNENGQTALHWSARNGHINITKLLVIVCKAGDAIKDKMGWTALHWAAKNGHRHIVHLLITWITLKIETAQQRLIKK